MEKSTIFAFVATASLALSSCGSMGNLGQQASSSSSSSTTSTSSSSSTTSSLLGSALSALLGNSNSLEESDLIGAWKYSAPDCRFEDENLLKQAGGEIAAQQVESKLSELFEKYGFTGSSVSVTFEEGGTCQFTASGHSASMKYTFDEDSRTLSFTGALGLANFSATACKSSSSKLSLLFDSDKLLSLISLIGSYSSNTTVQSLSSLLGSYDGMKIGMEFTK